MTLREIVIVSLLSSGCCSATAGEKSIAALHDMSQVELKYAGFVLQEPASVHIVATGAGGGQGWTGQKDPMFAYGWILNADTREPVWELTPENSDRHGDERSYDGTIALPAGSYEVYFSAATFVYHSALAHINTNVDHRQQPLFKSKPKNHFFSWLQSWWSDDISQAWAKRAPRWGIECFVNSSQAGKVSFFTPPKTPEGSVLRVTGLGDRSTVRKAFTLAGPADIVIRAIGEEDNGAECADYSWIVDTRRRERVWEMDCHDARKAGGSYKNVLTVSRVHFEKGSYVLYSITDDTHSAADWNSNPPYDPLNYGVSMAIENSAERAGFSETTYNEDKNVIVNIARVGNNASRSEGFTLKNETTLRVLCFGERSNNHRTMADCGTIMDARTRARVWTMDADRTRHAGGASKNRYIDEEITLPAGSYIVTYVTDDSHAYGDWNDDPPFDPDHYGIMISATDPKFAVAGVEKYKEEKDKSIIAQIVRVGDSADRSVRFSLDRTTRVRVYAIGEAQDREMYDFGWIEDARTGTTIWEMTYGMTFHAGGARKNRMVNTSIVLDKGNYVLRYKTDDSHAYNDWNSDPPDDREYYGITLQYDTAPEPPPLPVVPPPNRFAPPAH
jgi:hypothetical protein